MLQLAKYITLVGYKLHGKCTSEYYQLIITQLINFTNWLNIKILTDDSRTKITYVVDNRTGETYPFGDYEADHCTYYNRYDEPIENKDTFVVMLQIEDQQQAEQQTERQADQPSTIIVYIYGHTVIDTPIKVNSRLCINGMRFGAMITCDDADQYSSYTTRCRLFSVDKCIWFIRASGGIKINAVFEVNDILVDLNLYDWLGDSEINITYAVGKILAEYKLAFVRCDDAYNFILVKSNISLIKQPWTSTHDIYMEHNRPKLITEYGVLTYYDNSSISTAAIETELTWSELLLQCIKSNTLNPTIDIRHIPLMRHTARIFTPIDYRSIRADSDSINKLIRFINKTPMEIEIRNKNNIREKYYFYLKTDGTTLEHWSDKNILDVCGGLNVYTKQQQMSYGCTTIELDSYTLDKKVIFLHNCRTRTNTVQYYRVKNSIRETEIKYDQFGLPMFVKHYKKTAQLNERGEYISVDLENDKINDFLHAEYDHGQLRTYYRIKPPVCYKVIYYPDGSINVIKRVNSATRLINTVVYKPNGTIARFSETPARQEYLTSITSENITKVM